MFSWADLSFLYNHDFLLANLLFSIKSYVLLSKFIMFDKIICFSKQIYEDKSLSQNHVFTFEISRLTIFISLLIVLIAKPRFYF